ncbi:MAG: hypothetical protein DRJ42_15965 [Deltaproteobacteria bacterium]|nr:MAG: hypothetical protein DRJ42_15965 [Deltaproteobacteria bacterium]
MPKISWSLSTVALAFALACGGSSGGGGGTTAPSLTCPAAGLPDVSPSYSETVEGLVVVPARANLRSATEGEMSVFRDFVLELQLACGESPAGAACELGALRSELTALTTADHSGLFTDIDASFDAALTSAHGDYPAPDRDCDDEAEGVCDGRAIAAALVRAVCELTDSSDDDESGGH